MNKKIEESISTTDFKQHFLQYINEINNNKNPLIITKRNKPIAKILPIDLANEKRSISCFGIMKGSIKINDDIVEFSSESEWETES